MKLTRFEQQMHERAVGLSKQYRKIESELIFVLQEIDRSELFKRLGKRSLFLYAVETLGKANPLLMHLFRSPVRLRKFLLFSVPFKSRSFLFLRQVEWFQVLILIMLMN